MIRVLLDVLSGLGYGWAFAGVILAWSGRISWKKYWLLRIFGDLPNVLTSVLDRDLLWVAIGAATIACNYWLWKTSKDDDDDWGKRLRSWAKSHIPKPTIVALRPAGSPA